MSPGGALTGGADPALLSEGSYPRAAPLTVSSGDLVPLEHLMGSQMVFMGAKVLPPTSISPPRTSSS